MARTISIPTNVYVPDTYGPFQIDNIPPNSSGCVLALSRPNGVWPLTSNDLILTFEVKYRIDGVFQRVAFFEAFGGTMPPRFGQLPQFWWASVTWPTKLVKGVLVPEVPDAGQGIIVVSQQLTTGGTFEWLL